jgi:hypothetical protein
MRRFAQLILAAVLALAAVAAWFAGSRPTESDYGYTPNPEGVREFLAELDQPTFRGAAAEAMAKAEEVDTFAYRTLSRVHERVYGTPLAPWNQGEHGSCVSFGFALAAWHSLCVDFEMGRLPMPPPVVATEPIYGGSRTAGRLPPLKRNNGGDGSYGAAAARWVSGKCANGEGGLLFRQIYVCDGETYDLTRYDIPRSRAWGRDGVPAPLAREARKLRAMAVAQVNDWQQLVAAVRAGYGVAICSNVGYEPKAFHPQVRDEHGFLPRAGEWGHCMGAGLGLRFKSTGSPDDGCLIANSWGRAWVTGPKWPADMPDGYFWARRRDVEAMLAQGDSFAVGGVDGFAWRDIDNHGWQQVPPDVSVIARENR